MLLLTGERYPGLSWEPELDALVRNPESLDLDVRRQLRDVLITASIIGNGTGDADLGLKWGEKAAGTHPGFLGVICSSSPTLGNALFNLTNVLPVIAEVGELCVGSVNGAITLQLVHSRREFAFERFFLDCLLSYLIQIISMSTLDGVEPDSVDVFYDCPEDETQIHRLLTHRIRYSRPYASFSYKIEDLARPMRAPHPVLLEATLSTASQIVQELDEMGRFRRQVSVEVRGVLDKPHPTLEKVAQGMNMSRRTLQRRLDESGLSFRELLRHERHEKALELLEGTDKSIAEIAYSLGFANQSAFSRAFRQILGISPRGYRSQLKKAGGEGA